MGKRNRPRGGSHHHRSQCKKRIKQTEFDLKEDTPHVGDTAAASGSSWHRLTHHGTDASTRHIILAALRHTRFHPDVLVQRKVPYPTELLQAVVSQVIPRQSSEYHHHHHASSSSSSSLRSKSGSKASTAPTKTSEIHCSIAAVACLSDYVAYMPDLDDETLLEQDATLTIEWWPIFVQRLQDCLLHSDAAFSSDESTSTSNNIHTTDIVWLELLEECLSAIVNLVEQNHLSSNRLLTRYHNNRYDYSLWNCLLQLLKQSYAVLASNTDNNDTVTATTGPTNKSESDSSLDIRLTWYRIQTLTAQCLHSSWDDNDELVTALFFAPNNKSNDDTDGPAVARQLLSSLQSILLLDSTVPSSSSSMATTPAVAFSGKAIAAAKAATRLHAAGATMALWNAQGETFRRNESPSSLLLLDVALFESLCRPCVNCVQQALTQTLVLFQTKDLMEGIVAQIGAAEADFRAERDDDQMEQDVLHHQHVKQEPARHIARRLHPHPASSTAATKDDTNDDEAKPKTKRTIQRKNATALWEEVQAEWEDTIRPLQLALELVANWTSGSSTDDGQDTDDNDTDDNEEDVVMHDVVQTSLSPELVSHFDECQLPALVVQILEFLSKWWCLPHNQPKPSSPSKALDTSPPLIVVESLSDCLSKAVVAVGHCRAAGMGAEVPWSDLMAVGRTLAGRVESGISAEGSGDGGGTLSGTDASVLVAVTNTMMVALKNNPTLGVQVDTASLDSLLVLLSVTAKTYPVAAREIVAMLGVLICNTTERTVQSVARCRHITQALIIASTPPSASPLGSKNSGVSQHPSSLVVAEVLNVFMDIYGGDEDETESALSFNQLFEELGLLSYFQRSVPLLKRSIAVELLTKTAMEEDLDLWSETAENALRFVQYQKDLRR